MELKYLLITKLRQICTIYGMTCLYIITRQVWYLMLPLLFYVCICQLCRYTCNTRTSHIYILYQYNCYTPALNVFYYTSDRMLSKRHRHTDHNKIVSSNMNNKITSYHQTYPHRISCLLSSYNLVILLYSLLASNIWNRTPLK